MNTKNEVIWKGEWKRGHEWNGEGEYKWLDMKKNLWIVNGNNLKNQKI